MKCTQIKKNGDQCGANAMRGADLCYLHNTDISAEEKRETRTRGGLNRALTVGEPLPEIQLKAPQDAVGLLADTINRVRAGSLDVRIANSIGALAGQLIKAFEVTAGQPNATRENPFMRLKLMKEEAEAFV